MIENLKKLANKLPEGKERSELLAEIEKLEKADLISKPKSLEDILNGEEFTDLKSQFDKHLGSFRTKWEKEQEEARIKEKLAGGKNPEDKKEDDAITEMFNKLSERLDEKFGLLTEQVTGLQSEKKVDTLKSYLSEKLKGLPEEFSGLITLSPEMTTGDIDKKIDLLTTAREKLLKDIDNSPYVGKPKTGEGNLQEWKEALPIKETKK